MSCDGLDVKRVETVCYLGVTLDQHLDGQAQARSVIKKVASRLGFLYRAAYFLHKVMLWSSRVWTTVLCPGI